MEKKESKPVKGIVQALFDFQQACPAISKESKAGQGNFSYKYGSLPHIMEAIKPHLKKVGIVVMQPIVWEEGSQFIYTRLYHVESGEQSESKILLPETEFKGMNAIQSAGAVITYNRRYALMAILGLVTDDDDTDAVGVTSKPVSGKKSAGSVADLPWLNPMAGGIVSPTWKEAVKYLAGEGKIADIKQKYRIAKANEEKLLNEAMSYNDIPGLNVDESNTNFENQ